MGTAMKDKIMMEAETAVEASTTAPRSLITVAATTTVATGATVLIHLLDSVTTPITIMLSTGHPASQPASQKSVDSAGQSSTVETTYTHVLRRSTLCSGLNNRACMRETMGVIMAPIGSVLTRKDEKQAAPALPNCHPGILAR